jgi:hypothetical protein
MFLLGILAIFCYSPVVGKAAFKINMLMKAATILGMHAESEPAEERRARAAVKPVTRAVYR